MAGSESDAYQLFVRYGSGDMDGTHEERVICNSDGIVVAALQAGDAIAGRYDFMHGLPDVVVAIDDPGWMQLDGELAGSYVEALQAYSHLDILADDGTSMIIQP